jgi:hypothetical protein
LRDTGGAGGGVLGEPHKSVLRGGVLFPGVLSVAGEVRDLVEFEKRWDFQGTLWRFCPSLLRIVPVAVRT